MSLPYTIILKPDKQGGWFIKIAELKWCMSEGRTREEALKNIEDAKYKWLINSLYFGELIPEPKGIKWNQKCNLNTVLNVV